MKLEILVLFVAYVYEVVLLLLCDFISFAASLQYNVLCAVQQSCRNINLDACHFKSKIHKEG